MPVHVEEMTSEVSAFDADLPMSEAQIEKLVKIVMQRMERRQQESKRSREATALRPHAVPPPRHGD